MPKNRYDVVLAKTVTDLYLKIAQTHGERVAFATQIKKKMWKPTTYHELVEQGKDLAAALIDLKIKKKEQVGILADNRLEWAIADCAIQLIGAADVPRGTDVTDADIQYIIPHAGIKVCFVENLATYKKVNKNKP